MLTKIYNFEGNFLEIENSNFLTKFYDVEGKFNLLKPLYNNKGKFIPLEFVKEHKKVLTLVMLGVTVGGIALLNYQTLGIPYLAGKTVACFTNTVGEATTTTTNLSTIWERLKPLIRELTSGADVIGVLSLIYCGFLLLLGQPTKANKMFKTAVQGYLLIRLSPIIIDFIGIIAGKAV